MKRNDFLFAKPSYISGIAKILDIGSTNLTYKFTRNEATAMDLKALSSDWSIIGEDMRGAINDYETQYEKELEMQR